MSSLIHFSSAGIDALARCELIAPTAFEMTRDACSALSRSRLLVAPPDSAPCPDCAAPRSFAISRSSSCPFWEKPSTSSPSESKHVISSNSTHIRDSARGLVSGSK